MARQRSRRVVLVGQNVANPSQCADPLIHKIASSTALPSAKSEKWLIKIASSSAHTNGSRASEHFVAESLEGRRTHTRSVIVTTNGEKCGHWIQICENTRRYVVFVQSAAKHRKSLIFNKWSTCSVGERNAFHLSYSASFDGCWKRILKRGLHLQNQEDTEWYKWHQPKIWEVERSEARLTLAHMRLAETKKSPWQWASMGCLWSKRGKQECWVSLWCSLQIQTQNLNVIIF